MSTTAFGACERTHRVLAAKMTPYMNRNKDNWEEILPAIVFSMNSAVNTTSGYSPFEVIFGQRPSFPLSEIAENLENLPTDTHSYMLSLKQKLDSIRVHMQERVVLSQCAMTDRLNKNT